MKYLSAFLGLVLLSLPVQAQAQDSYNIQPGDVLRIEVLEDPSLNRDALVLPEHAKAADVEIALRNIGIFLK